MSRSVDRWDGWILWNRLLARSPDDERLNRVPGSWLWESIVDASYGLSEYPLHNTCSARFLKHRWVGDAVKLCVRAERFTRESSGERQVSRKGSTLDALLRRCR